MKMTPKASLELAAWLFQLVHRDPVEVSEQLLTNSDAVRVLEEGLTSYMQELKAQIERDTKSLEPKVTASCSIDRDNLEGVDVTLWFTQASDEDLFCLREQDYGGESAENIVHFLVFFNSDVEASLLRTSDPEVRCQVNREEAEAWMMVHRAHGGRR